MIHPIVPHICDALWTDLGKHDVMQQPWPTVDSDALVRETVTLVVQVNGKLRGRVEVEPGADRDQVEALAMSDSNVQRFVDGLTVRKVIVIPDKLINIVVSP